MSLSHIAFFPIWMMSPLLIRVFLIICVPANHYFLCIRSGRHPMSTLILAFRLSMLRLWLMVTQCSFFHPTSFILIISFSGSLSMFLSAVSIVYFNCSIYFFFAVYLSVKFFSGSMSLWFVTECPFVVMVTPLSVMWRILELYFSSFIQLTYLPSPCIHPIRSPRANGPSVSLPTSLI